MRKLLGKEGQFSQQIGEIIVHILNHKGWDVCRLDRARKEVTIRPGHMYIIRPGYQSPEDGFEPIIMPSVEFEARITIAKGEKISAIKKGERITFMGLEPELDNIVLYEQCAKIPYEYFIPALNTIPNLEGIKPIDEWEKANEFDDVLAEEEIKLIEELDREDAFKKACGHLMKDGKHFYYCGMELPEKAEGKVSFYGPVCCRHIGSTDLRIFCAENYDRCVFIINEQKRKTESLKNAR